MHIKKILILSARYLKENPYREILLVQELRKKNYAVTLVFPSRIINKNGYTKQITTEKYFKLYNIIYSSNPIQLALAIIKQDVIIFGSWKDYHRFALFARCCGKIVINFNSTSGLDHWDHGVEYSFIKGQFSKKYFLFLQDKSTNKLKIPESNLIITGSIIHNLPQYYKDSTKKLDFKKKYNITKPLAVFFPKAIGGMNKKVPLWFKEWSPQKCNDYCKRLEFKYKEVIEKLTENDFDVIVKMHPTAYTEYITTYNTESKFWKQFSNVKILEIEDTYSCYMNMTVGVGITTHSALDTGFFKKPFIYVDSHQFEIPKNNIVFQIQNLTSLPIGPSSHWDKQNIYLNPWFPSWLGFYCTIDNMHLILNHIKSSSNIINYNHYKMFIDEFWGGINNNPVQSIVNETLRINTIKQKDNSRIKFMKDLVLKWQKM